ncbi:MAG: arsenical-resistance protein [Candidatus Heimdallarchaeota archaeon]|nr:arsenical-resistance protein [Candidatus Heimdallarchaeota archaeon]
MNNETPKSIEIKKTDENIINLDKEIEETTLVEVTQIAHVEKEHKLGVFEKYLALWVAICMAIGILLSQFVPIIGETLNSWQVSNINIPIGICLFFMMYPALLNLQFSEVKKLGKNPLPIIIALISNWLIAPFVAAGLGYLFLRNYDPQLIVAVILLGSSPCTAMVLVWGSLAKGNQEQNVINTSINTITIIFLYVPIVKLLTGIQDIEIPWLWLLISVSLFIGIPLILGVISKQVLTKTKGKEWFENRYRPIVGKISMVALLFTLIVLFSINGQVMIENPIELLLVSAPLLIGFVIVVGLNLLVTKLFRFRYKEAIITTIIGSSSHFEIAIATAIGIYGVGSMAALGTTMGLFWEVPIMLGLVYLAKFLNKKNFWKAKNKEEKEEVIS